VLPARVGVIAATVLFLINTIVVIITVVRTTNTTAVIEKLIQHFIFDRIASFLKKWFFIDGQKIQNTYSVADRTSINLFVFTSAD
jgi:hypothetical protein